MKILHLVTSFNGGAGIAARRIVNAQIVNGMNSQLGAANGRPRNLMSHEMILPKSPLRKLESKAVTFAQTNFVQSGDLLVTPFTISILSSSKDLIESSDIVHIHSFYNMLNWKDISRLAQNKKIFVTLHDERFYTGGCHYTCGCEGYRSGCFKCPQVKGLARRFPTVSIKSSINAWSDTNGVTFIAPSKWLAEKARESPLIEKSNVEFISNPVPPEFFVSRNTMANSHSSHQNVLNVGFISENLNNPYKGIEILRNALRHIGDRKAINLKLFGSGSPGDFPSNTSVETRKFGNSKDAQKAISECDLIVVPSKQDNSPSVVAESLMCGVPVLGSRVGGVSETLHEFGLPTFESENVLDLATQILNFTPLKLSEEVMKQVMKKYAYETSASKHRQLYEK